MANLGEIVGGKYRLNEVLGEGGMGRVWRAWDEQLHRDVAIKEILLPADHPLYEELRARFLREARAAARLSHPGIVSVYEIVEHAGSPMIAMQYVQGRSLGALLEAEGPLPPKRVAEIGAQIADALSAAHKVGIVHRDMKPDNILISADNGQALVTDFGIALLQGGTVITDSGVVLGTVPFLSPEQAQWLGATDKSDVWALGVTLYVAVEGTRPFSAPENRELISKIVHQPFRPMENAGELTGVLTRMLSKAPDVRPDSRTVASLLRSAPPTITNEQRQELEKQLRKKLEKRLRREMEEAEEERKRREREEAARLRKLAQVVTMEEMLEKLQQENREPWSTTTANLPDLSELRPDLVAPGAGVTITRWFKEVGDTVEEGHAVLELSVHGVDARVSYSDSHATGVLHAFHAAEGQSVNVGSPLFTVINPYIAPTPPAAPEPAPAPAVATEPAAAAALTEAQEADKNGLTTADKAWAVAAACVSIPFDIGIVQYMDTHASLPSSGGFGVLLYFGAFLIGPYWSSYSARIAVKSGGYSKELSDVTGFLVGLGLVVFFVWFGGTHQHPHINW